MIQEGVNQVLQNVALVSTVSGGVNAAKETIRQTPEYKKAESEIAKKYAFQGQSELQAQGVSANVTTGHGSAYLNYDKVTDDQEKRVQALVRASKIAKAKELQSQTWQMVRKSIMKKFVGGNE